MISIVVLQARTNSSRFPGKVLLPIKGIPIVVLAAQRAANTGRDVLVATSMEATDDSLSELVQSYGIRCFRGSLENALERFVNALAAYDDQTLVFRLTADNVFPDGALLDEIEHDFLANGNEYLCCNGEDSGLPYGMSVELTRLAHLRIAAKETTCAYDQEHITPYVIRKYGLSFFKKHIKMKKGHFRCTIDCLDDYVSVQKVFAGVDDPIQEPSFSLVSRLEGLKYQPTASCPVPKFVFGAAQLGSDYGIANTTGQPAKKECEVLIKTAIANGVVYLDTARAYGESESMIGYSLQCGWGGRAKVITKLSPLLELPKDVSESIVDAFVDASVFQSCAALKVQEIDVLMLHRASHISLWGGAVWQRLLSLRSSGVISELGVSVQGPEELLKALAIPDIQYIQLPYNLLDWRWDLVIPEILKTKNSRKLIIHVRSAFLQGLLLSADEEHWLRANIDDGADVRGWLLNQVDNYKRDNIADLCLSYLNALEWVDGVALGNDNISQLTDNINYFNNYPLSVNEVNEIQNKRPKLNEITLNPALWSN